LHSTLILDIIFTMCIPQFIDSSEKLSSQIRSQTLGFLQKYSNEFDDDNDSLFGDSCSLEDLDTFDTNMFLEHTTHHLEETSTSHCLSRATSRQSLSSMTVLSNMSGFDMNKLIDDEAVLHDDDQTTVISDDSSVDSVNSFEVEELDWRQMSDFLGVRPEDSLYHQISLQSVSIEEARMNHLNSMTSSYQTSRALQEWDRKMGLRRCHCKTMMDSSISRKRLLQTMGVQVPDEEKELKRQQRQQRQQPSKKRGSDGYCSSIQKRRKITSSIELLVAGDLYNSFIALSA